MTRRRRFRLFGIMTLLLAIPSALSITVATADHPASEIHLDAGHGGHETPVTSGAQQTESRVVAFAAVPATPPAWTAELPEYQTFAAPADRAPPRPPPPKAHAPRAPPTPV